MVMLVVLMLLLSFSVFPISDENFKMFKFVDAAAPVKLQSNK